MKAPKRVLQVLAIAALGFLMLGLSGDERSWSGQQTVVLPADAVHDGWYFAAGNAVIIQGTVRGDAYVAGGMVRVEGTIEGDLLAAGGNVVINGRVTDDVRAAGGNIECNGSVGKNVTVAGGTVVFGKSSSVDGGVLAAGGEVSVMGLVAKDMKVASERLAVLGTVRGNLGFGGEQITVHEGARVGGKLVAHVEDSAKADIAPGTVAGTIKLLEAPQEGVGGEGMSFLGKLLWILALVVTALVLVLLFPGTVNRVGVTVVARPGGSLLWGLLALIAVPFAAIVLLVTVIGIPVALLLLTMYVWLLYLTQLSFAIVLAHGLFKSEGKRGWSLFWPVAVSLIVVELIILIPYIGFPIRLAAVLFGLGALVLLVEAAWKRPAPAAVAGGATE